MRGRQVFAANLSTSKLDTFVYLTQLVAGDKDRE
jgi:hypothetical protein